MFDVLEKELIDKTVHNEHWPTPYGWDPPLAWTQPDPSYKPGDSIVITPEGQFKAYSHDWVTYHIGTTAGGGSEPWKAVPSPTNNKAFNQGAIHTADGVEVSGGGVPLNGGHADPYATAAEAQAHYENPEYVRVAAVANDTPDGCQINGFVVPGTTYGEVAMMRLLGLSGDWRWFPQLASLDYIGPCFVPRQGLPKGVVTASALYGLHDQPLFTDRMEYHAHRGEGGNILSVTASLFTERINKVDLKNKFSVTAAADTSIEGQNVDFSVEVNSLREKVEQLELMVLKLQSAGETVDEIDLETPDS